jgi:hypothetical protein
MRQNVYMSTIAYKKIPGHPHISLVDPPRLDKESFHALEQAAQALDESPLDQEQQRIVMVEKIDYQENKLYLFETDLSWKIAMASPSIQRYSLGALSVGCMIFNEQQEMLWRQHSYSVSDGKWGISGKNFVQKGFLPEEVVVQQLEDQLNLDSDQYTLKPLAYVIIPGSGDVFVLYGAVIENDAVIRPSSEVADLLWADLNEPPHGISKIAAGLILAAGDLYPDMPQVILT